MYDDYEDRTFTYSTADEWDRAEAYERGEANPAVAWICTDRDAWHPNPYYKGEPVPHPESEEAEAIRNADYEAFLIEEYLNAPEPVYSSDYGYEDAAPTHDEVGDIPF